MEQGTLQSLVTVQLSLVNSYLKDNSGPGGAHLSMRSRGALSVRNTTFHLQTGSVQVRGLGELTELGGHFAHCMYRENDYSSG